jgi:dienelactone hydrolase
MTERQIDGHTPEYGRHQVRNNLLYENGQTNVFGGQPSIVAGNWSEGITAAFNRQTMELTWSVAHPPPECEPVPAVSCDFFGIPRKGRGIVAGPFEPIPAQPSQVKLWRGVFPPPDSPWDLNALGAAPKWTALERPKSEGIQAITFEGLPFRRKTTRVFAWLGVPKVKTGEKVPAMVLIHGGGGTAFDEWVRLWMDRGYAAIAMDTCGQVPVGNYGKWFRDEQGGPPGWGGFDQVARPREDQWTYHAIADAILAHSLIRSLPQVDPERTGVTGISWGGYLTCIVAGVDPRFKLAVPVYGCGFYRDTLFEGELNKLPAAEADRWMAWWDPSVYLGGADLPILWVTGSNDFAYTMNALQRSYRLSKGPRSLCIRLRMPHGHGGAGENPKEIQVFADSILKRGLPLPAITGCGRDGTNAWATYSTKVPLAKAELNFTRDIGRWQDRKWESIPAEPSEGRVTAGLPAGTRVYYFNLFDERNCAVSTEHEECSLP